MIPVKFKHTMMTTVAGLNQKSDKEYKMHTCMHLFYAKANETRL